MRTTLCFVALVAGCTSTPPSASNPRAVEPRPVDRTPPKPEPAPETPVVEPPAAAAKLGDDCSKGQACSAPAACISYLGFAGARGPTFKTCEKVHGEVGVPDRHQVSGDRRRSRSGLSLTRSRHP